MKKARIEHEIVENKLRRGYNEDEVKNLKSEYERIV